MHEGDRPEPLPGGSQQRVGDGVVAADRQQAAGIAEQGGSGRLDLVDGLLDVERIARDVAGIRHLLRAERRHLQAWVPGPQQPRSLPDRGRTEAGPWPVGRAAIERDADHCHVAAGDLGATTAANSFLPLPVPHRSHRRQRPA
jgi:hypothetical protein